jgi:hypothetical protein
MLAVAATALLVLAIGQAGTAAPLGDRFRSPGDIAYCRLGGTLELLTVTCFSPHTGDWVRVSLDVRSQDQPAVAQGRKARYLGFHDAAWSPLLCSAGLRAVTSLDDTSRFTLAIKSSSRRLGGFETTTAPASSARAAMLTRGSNSRLSRATRNTSLAVSPSESTHTARSAGRTPGTHLWERWLSRLRLHGRLDPARRGFTVSGWFRLRCLSGASGLHVFGLQSSVNLTRTHVPTWLVHNG